MFEKAKIISGLIKSKKFECYVVGGAVRDLILKKIPIDIDFATNASLEDLYQIIKEMNFTMIPTGLKHNTVTVLIDNEAFEISSYRKNQNSCPPPNHSPTRLDDASTRDFTMNALYLDIDTNDFFDPYNGRKDIENKIIAYVQDPKDRINEDPLRILRAFRFMSTLGFCIEKNSLKQSLASLDDLFKVSPERIRVELLKLLSGEFVEPIFNSYFDVFFAIIPELKATFNCVQNTPWHIYDVFTHTKHVVLGLPSQKPLLRLVGLFHDIAKPKCKTTDELGIDHFYKHDCEAIALILPIMKRLKFSNKEIAYVCFLVERHMALNHDISEKGARRLIKNVREHFFSDTESILEDLILLAKADRLAQNPAHLKNLPFYDPAVIVRKELANKNNIYESPLTGEEIKNLFNLSEGKIIGLIKDYLIDQIIEGHLLQDDKNKAISLSRDYYESLKS